MNDNRTWLILLIAILFFASQNKAPVEDGGVDIDLAQAIDSGVSFTASDMYVPSTQIRLEDVRVIKLNGGSELKDLGYKSVDSSSMSTTPNAKYKFYYFMNTTASSYYYVDVVDYTAPLQDAVDDQVGHGCSIDTTLDFNVNNQGGGSDNTATNPQSIGVGETKTVRLSVTVSNNKCYGMPDSPKNNAICFTWNQSIFSQIEASTPSAPTPRGLINQVPEPLICYELPLLKDRETAELTVDLTAGAEPTTLHNISVYSDDIAFDLDDRTLAEIYDYTDEYGAELAAGNLSLGTIYIS